MAPSTSNTASNAETRCIRLDSDEAGWGLRFSLWELHRSHHHRASEGAMAEG